MTEQSNLTPHSHPIALHPGSFARASAVSCSITWALERWFSIIKQKELPGITLHVLPNGNLIVGNCHAGADQPQLFEVTREKKVVWTFKDHKTFGNSLASAQVLGVDPKTLR